MFLICFLSSKKLESKHSMINMIASLSSFPHLKNTHTISQIDLVKYMASQRSLAWYLAHPLPSDISSAVSLGSCCCRPKQSPLVVRQKTEVQSHITLTTSKSHTGPKGTHQAPIWGYWHLVLTLSGPTMAIAGIRSYTYRFTPFSISV